MREGYFLIKLLVVGDKKVGKSCLINWFIQDHFSEIYTATRGVTFSTHTLYIEQDEDDEVKLFDGGANVLKLQFWDVSGNDELLLEDRLLIGTQGIIFTYDISNRESFENIKEKIKLIKKVGKDLLRSTVFLLIGNKTDLEDRRKVSLEEAIEFAQASEMAFLETSAKESYNVFEGIFSLLKEIQLFRCRLAMESNKKETISTKTTQVVTLPSSTTTTTPTETATETATTTTTTNETDQATGLSKNRTCGLIDSFLSILSTELRQFIKWGGERDVQ
jgi:Ras-related protein Rab-1A